MNELIASAVLAQSEPASGSSLLSYAFLPLMLAAFYFLIIRPNGKKRKNAAALQSALTVGDEVMTTGGIIGTITGEDGPTRFWLEIDNDVQVRIARAGIQGRIEDEADATDATDDADDDVDTDAAVESAERD